MINSELLWDVGGKREHGEIMMSWETIVDHFPDDNPMGYDEYKITTHYVVVGPTGKTLLAFTIEW